MFKLGTSVASFVWHKAKLRAYFNVIKSTGSVCFHVKRRDKVEDHVIALLYVDVPHTLRVVGVTAGVVGTGDQTRLTVVQTSTS